MTNEEANKVIAEYMDNQIEIKIVGNELHLYDRLDACWYEFYCKYTSSLNALVPVWEKLGGEEIYIEFRLTALDGWCFSMEGESFFSHESATSSAAHATASAIKKQLTQT
jgi:hypothetical protein